MSEWVSINGELVRGADATVSVFDSGFMQGVGLFETMRAYHGRLFRLPQHLERLRGSAKKLGWQVLPALEEMRAAVEQVVQAAARDEARVRLTVTTGSLHAGAGDEPKLTLVASAAPGGRYPVEYYQHGAALALTQYRQSEFDPTAGHKTTSYFARLASLREAHARHCVEALWFTLDNFVAEGAISNIFSVSGQQLHTPPLDLPVLPGVTRAAVLELAQAIGLRVVQEPQTLEDLLAAEEVFLTSSLMGLLPIVRVEREQIGNGKPGPTWRHLAELYHARIEQECA